MHPRQIAAAFSFALLLPTAAPATAHEAHVHGIGRLAIALDGETLSLHLDSPLGNLIGVEHTVRSARDRQAAQDMAGTLRNAAAMFVTTPAAECRLGSVQLASAAIEPALLGETATGKTAMHADQDGHSDLHADFHFQCAQPGKLQRIDVKLFDAFQGFERIDVQLVTSRHQGAAKLTPAASSIIFP